MSLHLCMCTLMCVNECTCVHLYLCVLGLHLFMWFLSLAWKSPSSLGCLECKYIVNPVSTSIVLARQAHTATPETLDEFWGVKALCSQDKYCNDCSIYLPIAGLFAEMFPCFVL